MDELSTGRVRFAWKLSQRLLRGETVRFEGGGVATPCQTGTGSVFWAFVTPDGLVLETGDPADIAIEVALWGFLAEDSEGAP